MVPEPESRGWAGKAPTIPAGGEEMHLGQNFTARQQLFKELYGARRARTFYPECADRSGRSVRHCCTPPVQTIEAVTETEQREAVYFHAGEGRRCCDNWPWPNSPSRQLALCQVRHLAR